jgi:hypothetical protein
MSSAEKIKRLFAKSSITVGSGVDDRIVHDAMMAFDESEGKRLIYAGPNIGRNIMRSRMIKLTVAAVIIIAIFVGISHFGGSIDGTSVAFGEVLQQIRNSSYNFELTTIGDVVDKTYHGMILQSEGLRIDDPEDGVSSITNFNAGQVLVLLHRNKIAITEFPDTENLVDSGPFAFFLNSIENLWNLKDGTENSLGAKEIDGQPAVGFEVHQKGEDFISDVIIWAHKETGAPIQVEITLHDPENIHSVTMIMSKFDLNAKLDKELFSAKPPIGYKVTTYQKLRENPADVYRQR